MADLRADDVLKLAQLARLSLSDEEVAEFQAEISEILGYVEQLQNIDITGLEPTSQVTGLTNVSRPDEVADYGYEAQVLLDNVPNTDQGLIKVKRMID